MGTESVNVIQLIFVFKGLIRHCIPITFVYKGTSYSTYCVACKPNLDERLYSRTPTQRQCCSPQVAAGYTGRRNTVGGNKSKFCTTGEFCSQAFMNAQWGWCYTRLWLYFVGDFTVLSLSLFFLTHVFSVTLRFLSIHFPFGEQSWLNARGTVTNKKRISAEIKIMILFYHRKRVFEALMEILTESLYCLYDL